MMAPRPRKNFETQPGRTLLFAVLFSFLVVALGHFPWLWLAPTLLVMWAIFSLMQWFYVWANNKIEDTVEQYRK
ncbi:hypothetical protein GP475_02790 [Corynebacterium poyangense]|uniref:Uncharacterized protein n=1 Tax=Corynebacterium poyangense TaxID=2684405 RepID=A0A7H0SMB4_9CORY|nr:hypothetical protein [Corynebacterium poyangense]MBZ8176789.1 hypothetical protein [Corynebacterium poyangense]QNQ89689.1 hypothetical protein GP475_02790 [Corynebacterium poyangense]